MTDEANKAISLITMDARLAVGYSGLARVGDIDMEERLVSLLQEVAPPEREWRHMRHRFVAALDEQFQEPLVRAIPPRLRATSIHLIGYANTTPPLPISTFITNHNDPVRKEFGTPIWNRFRQTTQQCDPESNGVMVQALGAYRGISQSDMNPLIAMMREGRPPHAVISKGVNLIRRWADRPQSSNTIGKQVMSIWVPADFMVPVQAEYYSNAAQPTTYLASSVDVRPNMGAAMRGGWLRAMDGTPTAVPKAGRNQPCPCGSGSKYKRCHGHPDRSRRISVELERVPDSTDGTST